MKFIEGNNEKLKVRSSIGASDLSLTLDGPLSNNSSLIFSYRRSYLQFLFSALGLPFLPTYDDFQFKFKYAPTSKQEIIVLGLGAIDRNTLNLSADKTESQRYILSYLPDNDQWNYSIVTAIKLYADNGYQTFSMSRSMLNNTQIKYSNNIEDPQNLLLNYLSFETSNQLRYEKVIFNKSNYKLSYGGQIEYSRYYNNTYRKKINSEDTYLSNIDIFKWGAFAQASRTFFNRLTLSLGIRTDANNYSSEMNNILNQISPRFSSSYKLNQYINLNANIGRYYQLPSYTTLGYRNENNELINKQNRIKYISSDHIVSGIEFLPNSNSKFSIEGFGKFYDNYPISLLEGISLASEGAEYGSYGDEEVVPTGKGRAYGIDVYYQNRDIWGTNLVLSYTISWSEFTDQNGNYTPSSYDSRHLLNVLMSRSFKNNWTVGIKWRFVGGLPFTPIDFEKSSLVDAWNVRNQAYPDYNRYNSLRLKPFHQLDIRVDKEYYFKRWSLIAYVDIQNIYNFKADRPPIYVVDNSIPPVDNRYTLKKLNTTGGGTILPTIGIIAQW